MTLQLTVAGSGDATAEEYEVLVTGLNADGDPIPHTGDHPFCDDPTCPCKDDAEAIQTVAAWVDSGLMTRGEADFFYQGKTF
jgi:hypothetical protein